MAKSVIEVALANIDAKIAALQHAKELIVAASTSEPAAEKPKRGRKPRKGLPGFGIAGEAQGDR